MGSKTDQKVDLPWVLSGTLIHAPSSKDLTPMENKLLQSQSTKTILKKSSRKMLRPRSWCRRDKRVALCAGRAKVHCTCSLRLSESQLSETTSSVVTDSLGIDQVLKAFSLSEKNRHNSINVGGLKHLVRSYDCCEEIGEELLKKVYALQTHEEEALRPTGLLTLARVCSVESNARDLLTWDVLPEVTDILQKEVNDELTEAALEALTQIVSHSGLVFLWRDQVLHVGYGQVLERIRPCCPSSIRAAAAKALYELAAYKEFAWKMACEGWTNVREIKEDKNCQETFLELVGRLANHMTNPQVIDKLLEDFLPLCLHIIHSSSCDEQCRALLSLCNLCSIPDCIVSLTKSGVFTTVTHILATSDCFMVQAEVAHILKKTFTFVSNPDVELKILVQCGASLKDCQEKIQPIHTSYRPVQEGEKGRENKKKKNSAEDHVTKAVKRFGQLVVEKLKLYGGLILDDKKQVCDVAIPHPMTTSACSLFVCLFELLQGLIQINSLQLQAEFEDVPIYLLKRMNQIKLRSKRALNVKVCEALVSSGLLLCIDFLSGFSQFYLSVLSDIQEREMEARGADQPGRCSTANSTRSEPSSARPSSQVGGAWNERQVNSIIQSDPQMQHLFTTSELMMIETLLTFLEMLSRSSVPVLPAHLMGSAKEASLEEIVTSELGLSASDQGAVNGVMQSPSSPYDVTDSETHGHSTSGVRAPASHQQNKLHHGGIKKTKSTSLTSTHLLHMRSTQFGSYSMPAMQRKANSFSKMPVVTSNSLCCDYCLGKRTPQKGLKLASVLETKIQSFIDSPGNSNLDSRIPTSCFCEELQREFEEAVRSYERLLIKHEAPIQRKVRAGLYEAGLVEACGPLLLAANSPALQTQVLLLLRNMVQFVQEDPHNQKNKHQTYTSLLSVPRPMSRSKDTQDLRSVMSRLSSKTRQFLENTFSLNLYRQQFDPSDSNGCPSDLRRPPTTAGGRMENNAGSLSNRANNRLKAGAHFSTNYDRFARSKSSSKSTLNRSTKSVGTTKSAKGYSSLSQQNSDVVGNRFYSRPLTTTSRSYQRPKGPVFGKSAMNSLQKDGVLTTRQLQVRPKTGGRRKKSRAGSPPPTASSSKSGNEQPDVESLPLFYNDLLPLNVLGPRIDSDPHMALSVVHQCWSGVSPAAKTSSKDLDHRPLTRASSRSSTVLSESVLQSGRYWLPWKPDLDTSRPLGVQCRCLVAAVIGPLLLQRLFAKDAEQRKGALNLVHQYVENAEGESRMRLSEIGIMPKMVDFLRVNEDDEFFAMMGLTVVQGLICEDTRLLNSFDSHGGVDLLTALMYYSEGRLREQVKQTLKVATSDVHTQDASDDVEFRKQDIWEKITREWKEQDRVDEIFKKYSGV